MNRLIRIICTTTFVIRPYLTLLGTILSCYPYPFLRIMVTYKNHSRIAFYNPIGLQPCGQGISAAEVGMIQLHAMASSLKRLIRIFSASTCHVLNVPSVSSKPFLDCGHSSSQRPVKAISRQRVVRADNICLRFGFRRFCNSHIPRKYGGNHHRASKQPAY